MIHLQCMAAVAVHATTDLCDQWLQARTAWRGLSVYRMQRKAPKAH